MRFPRSLLWLGNVLLALLWSAAGFAGSYDAPLPPQLASDPDLCAYAPCREVMPGADSFSLRKGRPGYVEAYRIRDEYEKAGRDGRKDQEDEHQEGEREEREHGELIGYVFLSTDIVDIPAYSGKPMVTLIGMDTRGIIRGVRVLKHSEPILLVGIPEAQLDRFIAQYIGKFAGAKVEIGTSLAGSGRIGLDAISGATVTVIAENQTIMRSAYAVARQVGIVKAVPRAAARFTALNDAPDWNAMVREGAIERLTVKPGDLGLPETGEPYIDMYFGYLNAPAIGRAMLGADGYARLMADLKADEHAIFIVANGLGSFKGSGFVRGGIYDRIQVLQEIDSFTFRDTDYLNLYRIEAAGAPSFRESGIFIIRNPAFSAAYPWHMVFLGNKMDRETRVKSFVNFEREYWLPARYLEGGRPAVSQPEPAWQAIWKAKQVEIAIFLLLLAATATVYGLRDHLVRRATHKDKRWVSWPKYAIWTASIGFVGFYTMAQPSITQVLTWFHALAFEWKWELFLSDPLIFIFWWFLLGTTLVWGRGLFCGWLCPYGSLSEIAFKLTRATPLRRFQFELPQRLHDKLKWTKYAVFAGLLAVSFWSMGAAEQLAEIEPFKTTFLVGVLNRSWPFALYFVALLVLSMFTERPFCKYLCPLGAGLAMPTTFRWFGLKRKAECTTCHACQAGCGPQAIADDGRIDPRECLLCLDCQILYYDDHGCPPLVQERKRRGKAGLPLTPIAGNGYYIPIKPVPADKPAQDDVT
ncbi:MAG: 4Fe-4S binding protein [Rhodocyclales bacterium]|nr:4Fe-4S binding protein [Rhodocyclales bacterium]